MPRLLAIGHVTWDLVAGRDVLGGTVSYAALTAQKLGWDAAVLTSAGPDFDGARELPGIEVFTRGGRATTRFMNLYDGDGRRRQVLSSRADDIELFPLPDAWRDPDVLLLSPVAGEIHGALAQAFEAGVVGAIAQGWLREFDTLGNVSPRAFDLPSVLTGVHALFFSHHDMPDAAAEARRLLEHVPIVALTRGWEGLSLFTREAVREVPTLPRPETDPTGAGDVFAAAFLVRYHETAELVEAAAFGACAASCVVEGVGASTLGSRDEITRRLAQRERLIEEGEWEE
jgi:sugar/nucleoside kinase (ribokinase family)